MNIMRLLLIATLVMIVVSPSLAASAVDPYAGPQLEPSTPWLAIMYGLVFVAGICVVGFKNPGRTHLD